MYNSTTRPEIVTNTIFDEYKRAKYWHAKQYHGPKGYKRMCDELRLRAVDEQKTVYSNLTNYRSAEGNNWFISTAEKVIKGGFCGFNIGFCFYETVASFGVFAPVITSNWENVDYEFTCISFSDHFFLRYMDKTKFSPFKGDKKALAYKIVKCIHESGVRTEMEENGLVRCDIHVPGGIGRGYMRKNCPFVEIRTFLKDEELNGKQKKVKRELVRSVKANRSKEQDLLFHENVSECMENFHDRHYRKMEIMKKSMKLDSDKFNRLECLVNAATTILGSLMTLEWADAYNKKYWDDAFETITPVIFKYIDDGNLNNMLGKALLYKECFENLNRDSKYKWNPSAVYPFVGFCSDEYSDAVKWVDEHGTELGFC